MNVNKKIKITKYKVINTKKDRKLIGEVLDLQKIKSKSVHSDDKVPTKKQKSTRDLLIEFMSEQRTFNIRIEKEILILNVRLDNFVSRFNNLVKVNKLNEE